MDDEMKRLRETRKGERNGTGVLGLGGRLI